MSLTPSPQSKRGDRNNLSREAWPRGLRRESAASYVGISPALFDRWVKDGTMPLPCKRGGVVLWDRFGLDTALEVLFYPTDAHSQWDSVKV